MTALLELDELPRGERLACRLEFVAFSNEEYLPIGEYAYIPAAAEGYFDRLLLAVNFDGLGHRLDALTLASFACSPHFRRASRRTAPPTRAHRRHDSLRWSNPASVLKAAELTAGFFRDVQSRPLA